MKLSRRVATTAFAVAAFAALHAQDTRNVTEPRIPSICQSVDARLVARAGALAADDETRLDIPRIQQAIDGCKPGTAVEHRPACPNNGIFSASPELTHGW